MEPDRIVYQNAMNAKEIYKFLVAGAGFEPTTFGL